MIKLFVDDIRIPPKGWKLARTITEAIRLLATDQVEEVSLDHDIAYVNTDSGKVPEETFAAVAWFIKMRQLAGYALPGIYFHTGNPIGGKAMAEILGVAYRQLPDEVK